MGRDYAGRPFRRLLAIREQADARARDAEHGARERRAHERELDQMLGANLDVGTDVEHQHGRARDRNRDRKRGTMDAPRALDVEEPGRDRGAGRAAGDERVGVTRRDRPRRAYDRRLGRRADGLGRIGRLGDRDRRIDDGDAVGHVTDLGGRTEESHVDAIPRRRQRRAGGHLGDAQVRSVRIHGHRHRRAHGRRTAGRDRDRAPARRSPRARRRCRTPGRPGAGAAGCGTAGTR